MEEISITATIHRPIQIVWEKWTNPNDMMQWHLESEEWYSPLATCDLRVGGKFLNRMEAKDGSIGFNFEGVFTEITPQKCIKYDTPDGRKVQVVFKSMGTSTKIKQMFMAEYTHPISLLQKFWIKIIANFKIYVEQGA